MSVPIHCPECGEMVDETGWGDEMGTFSCDSCDIVFEREANDVGGVSVTIVEESDSSHG